jgi:hypothetical protein
MLPRVGVKGEKLSAVGGRKWERRRGGFSGPVSGTFLLYLHAAGKSRQVPPGVAQAAGTHQIAALSWYYY